MNSVLGLFFYLAGFSVLRRIIILIVLCKFGFDVTAFVYHDSHVTAINNGPASHHHHHHRATIRAKEVEEVLDGKEGALLPDM